MRIKSWNKFISGGLYSHTYAEGLHDVLLNLFSNYSKHLNVLIK
jgi:hypothetical protein